MAGRAVATTGSPAAIASITAVGCASSREGKRKASAARSQGPTSACGPARRMRARQREAEVVGPTADPDKERLRMCGREPLDGLEPHPPALGGAHDRDGERKGG